MAWGGLNPALTSWRNGINQRFPKRGTLSDGGYADKAHGSNSQHQEDPDGTVDAFDMDVNLRGSSTPTGTLTERRLIEALKLDFEADRRSYLWIHNREIANRAVDDWRERDYGGASPHTEHVHWESRSAYEKDGSPWSFKHTDALLRELEGDMPLNPDDLKRIEAVVDKQVNEGVSQLKRELPALVGDLKVNVNPHLPKANMQPWSRVDGYGSWERARIEDRVKAVETKVDQILTAIKALGEGK